MSFRTWFLNPQNTPEYREWLLRPTVMQLKNIERMLNQMGAREDAADARFAELVDLVRQGSAAKDAEITALRSELANADADATRRVDEALAADSEFDADKKEAGNAALESLVAMPAPSEPSEPGDEEPAGPTPVDPEDPTEPGAPVDPTVPGEDPAPNVPSEN